MEVNFDDFSAFQIIFNASYHAEYDFRDTITPGCADPFVEVTLSQEGESILAEIEWVS